MFPNKNQGRVCRPHSVRILGDWNIPRHCKKRLQVLGGWAPTEMWPVAGVGMGCRNYSDCFCLASLIGSKMAKKKKIIL